MCFLFAFSIHERLDFSYSKNYVLLGDAKIYVILFKFSLFFGLSRNFYLILSWYIKVFDEYASEVDTLGYLIKYVVVLVCGILCVKAVLHLGAKFE